MCGILGPTAGESWLSYVGVPVDYPELGDLAREVDDAMWEAAEVVLAERKAEDPVLRTMADERCTLWLWVTVPAGTLPIGTEVEHDGWYGQVRARCGYDDRRFDPPDRVYGDWRGRLAGAPERTGWEWEPRLSAGDQVAARVPMPFDAAPLLRWIEQETGVQTRPCPPRRKPGPTRTCGLCGRTGTNGFRTLDTTGTTYCMGRTACNRRARTKTRR